MVVHTGTGTTRLAASATDGHSFEADSSEASNFTTAFHQPDALLYRADTTGAQIAQRDIYSTNALGSYAIHASATMVAADDLPSGEHSATLPGVFPSVSGDWSVSAGNASGIGTIPGDNCFAFFLTSTVSGTNAFSREGSNAGTYAFQSGNGSITGGTALFQAGVFVGSSASGTNTFTVSSVNADVDSSANQCSVVASDCASSASTIDGTGNSVTASIDSDVTGSATYTAVMAADTCSAGNTCNGCFLQGANWTVTNSDDSVYIGRGQTTSGADNALVVNMCAADDPTIASNTTTVWADGESGVAPAVFFNTRGASFSSLLGPAFGRLGGNIVYSDNQTTVTTSGTTLTAADIAPGSRILLNLSGTNNVTLPTAANIAAAYDAGGDLTQEDWWFVEVIIVSGAWSFLTNTNLTLFPSPLALPVFPSATRLAFYYVSSTSVQVRQLY